MPQRQKQLKNMYTAKMLELMFLSKVCKTLTVFPPFTVIIANPAIRGMFDVSKLNTSMLIFLVESSNPSNQIIEASDDKYIIRESIVSSGATPRRSSGKNPIRRCISLLMLVCSWRPTLWGPSRKTAADLKKKIGQCL